MRESGSAQGILDMRHRVVQFAMERAQRSAMSRDAQRAGLNAADWFHCVDNIQDGHFGGRFGERKAAMFASLANDQAGAGERLHDLEEVIRRDLRDIGNLNSRAGRPVVIG